MSVNSEIAADIAARPRKPAFAEWCLRKLVAKLEFGSITIVSDSGMVFEHRGTEKGPEAKIVLHSWRTFQRLFTHGDLGFADSYMDGDWSTPDLTAVLEFCACNISALDRNAAGLAPARLLARLRHLLRANTIAGSRKNISFHYDLGNAFYQRWLDESMTYSSAIYKNANDRLEDAQACKLDRITELLDVTDNTRVLEIGCGWGALAARLALAGAPVHGITLSTEQLAFATERCENEGLSDKVHLELRDYRDLAGQYDRIVSIEMLEAVGEAFWPVYFDTLHDRLKVGGKAVIQVITISEARYARYRSEADFIQARIFPGGMLPTKTIVAGQTMLSGLSLVSAEYFGDSYALTLAEWRKRFIAAWPEIAAMGFPEQFRRMWEYYLSYCEAGFRTGLIDVGLFVLERDR